MYLNKRFYVENWEHTPLDKRHEIIILQGEKVRTDIPADKISEVICNVMYWRKANAVHRWFVENCQDGNDDCREAYVSQEQLEELRNICERVLAECKLVKGKIVNGMTFKDGKDEPILEDGEFIEDPSTAEELLPTEEGFFFGGTSYDQWYYEDLQRTKDMLDKELAIEPNDASYYYHSSW